MKVLKSAGLLIFVTFFHGRYSQLLPQLEHSGVAHPLTNYVENRIKRTRDDTIQREPLEYANMAAARDRLMSFTV